MSEFKIAAAQFASVRGDLAGNIRIHTAAITAAAARGVSVLVFPELSLIGYEPDLAAELAISAADERLAPLAALAHQHQMAVVVGASLRTAAAKPGLGAILFIANGSPRTYAKMHLGGSEPTYFAPGGAAVVRRPRTDDRPRDLCGRVEAVPPAGVRRWRLHRLCCGCVPERRMVRD